MAKHTSWVSICHVDVRVGADVKSYISLAEAINDNRRILHPVLNSPVNSWSFGATRFNYQEPGYSFWRVKPVTVVFLDEMGLAIPIWRIRQAYFESGGAEECRRWYPSRGRRSYVDQVRDGAVPGTGARRGRHYRKDKVAQECRDLAGIEVGEDIRDFPGLVRAKRNRHALPSVFDEIYQARRGNNWKNHRQHQCRERC